MTEALLDSFQRKNPTLASGTYRYLWINLKSQGLRVEQAYDYRNRSALPVADRESRRLLIPACTILEVSKLPVPEALVATGLNPRPVDNPTLLGNKQIISSIRQIGRNYDSYLDKVFPLIDREVRNSRFMTGLCIPVYLIDKVIQHTPYIPVIMQGRLVDFMAVPILVSAYRAVRSFGMRSRMISSVDYLSNTTINETAQRLANVDAMIIASLLGCYIVEIGQGLELLPGTFDIGDFVAYTVGGALTWGLFRARETLVRRYLESNSSKKE